VRTIGNLIDTVCIIETWLIVARILISWFPSVDYHNPLIRALCMVTDPVLRIFRPLLPTFAGIDVSPIVAILVLRLVGNAFADLGIGLDPVQVVLDIVDQVILAVILIMIIIVFLRVVMTIFQADPWHTATRMVRDMARPLTSPFAAISVRSRSVDVPAAVALVFYIVAYFVVRRIFDEIIVRV
jgi:YggT family protein